ncbi:MAG: transcription antitermination factor NusB, partial [Bacteroidales bacterium]
LTELINFPSIPIKVSLNEYIEVSKRFCSEKSRIFVNGLLNKLASDLTESKIIKKSGRGLI